MKPSELHDADSQKRDPKKTHDREIKAGATEILPFAISLCQVIRSCTSEHDDREDAALTSVTVASIPLSNIGSLVRLNTRIEETLWWDLVVASTIEREHVVSLGRRSATERLGSLFCELHLRMEMVDLVKRPSLDMPVTQAELGDSARAVDNARQPLSPEIEDDRIDLLKRSQLNHSGSGGIAGILFLRSRLSSTACDVSP
jgi:hypothetical protein